MYQRIPATPSPIKSPLGNHKAMSFAASRTTLAFTAARISRVFGRRCVAADGSSYPKTTSKHSADINGGNALRDIGCSDGAGTLSIEIT